MARAVAIAMIALVAVCLVADASAAYCRTSSYKLDGATVRNHKADMFKNCGAKVEVVSSKQVGDCFVFVQKVANEAAWSKYSDCEKSAANADKYKPLKDNSKACEAQQKKGDC